jgi:outer membrane protein OmpA-like peptidoglycan-associated protein
MRKSLVAASMIALTVAVAPACATKKFVRTEVGNVNTKVDTLTGTVEETQERTRQNAERIGAVDAKAEAAGKSATDARSAADQAAQRATAANTEATKANTAAAAVNTRVDEVVARSGRLVYEVTLSEDQGNFKFGAAELPDEAKARIDSIVSSLKTDPKGVFIEIEGHTDNVGGKLLNERLGMERAETVKRYLYEQHQVPLHKINVISYGEDKPVAPNNTRDGRAQNRRVVIKVLV